MALIENIIAEDILIRFAIPDEAGAAVVDHDNGRTGYGIVIAGHRQLVRSGSWHPDEIAHLNRR